MLILTQNSRLLPKGCREIKVIIKRYGLGSIYLKIMKLILLIIVLNMIKGKNIFGKWLYCADNIIRYRI